MKIAHIYPVKNTEYTYTQDYSMFLTHLAYKYPTYLHDASICRAMGKYTILDNSLIENNGQPLTITSVCEVAETIDASEIILPDIFNDRLGTIESYKRSMEYLYHRYPKGIPFNIMVVAQGKDAKEFERCYQWFEEHGEMHTIGIPKVCSLKHPQGRPYFEYLWQNHNRRFDIHLLGLMYSFTELLEYENPELIRSVDTCQKAFLIREGKRWDSVRSNGFTIDLDRDELSTDKLKGMRRLECWIR